MRWKIIILILLPNLILGQENFFSAHDYKSLSQGYFNSLTYNDNIYTLGVTICPTGECGVLSKYGINGKLEFFKEIDNVDVNSSRCLGLRGDTISLIALSKYEVGARLQKYNLEGELLQDNLINRDTDLIYTWPLDVLYKEELMYLAVNENYKNESRQTAVYKLDYQGNVLDFIRLPYHYRGGILTLTELGNGNLFITQSYIDEGLCAFEHEEPDNINAVIFYEITADSLEIIREKEHMCYQSTSPVSYDCRVLNNGNIIRNILWRDSLNENKIHAANIYYDLEWEVIGIDKYPQLVIGNPLANYGIIGNRTFSSQSSNYFYEVSFDRYPIEGEDFPYVDCLIQKWDIDRNLIWERVISDPNVHHRIYFNSLYETESGIILAGYVWSDFDIAGTQDFAVMTLDLNGCFNGDCSDTIYLNGPPTSTLDVPDGVKISIFPNPFQDKITISATSPIRYIICYSMDGTVMLKEDVTSMEHTLDLGILPSGMYAVEVKCDGGRITKKVIKI